MKIEFFKHNLNEVDIAAASGVMRSLFLTTGPVVSEFEERFADYLGVNAAVGLTSCTGALHLALIRNGVGPGDEVITTPLTFVATATAILEAGAKPVFVDVCPRSGLLSPDKVERAITKRTKAILPVHLYGRMADMRGFSRLARRTRCALIEDAAHCIEGIRDGVRPGHLSDAACFSFYATKSMTCGEGGALACMSQADADWYRSARHHGISKNAAYRYTKQYRHWDMSFLGWKYNMDDIKAALLIPQIKRLDTNRVLRQELESAYRALLNEVEGMDFLDPPGEKESSGHHLFTVLLPRDISRDKVIVAMHKAGIGCAVNYRAVHVLKYFRNTFKYAPSDYPVADEIGRRTITLPLYPKLSLKSVEKICRVLKRTIVSMKGK